LTFEDDGLFTLHPKDFDVEKAKYLCRIHLGSTLWKMLQIYPELIPEIDPSWGDGDSDPADAVWFRECCYRGEVELVKQYLKDSRLQGLPVDDEFEGPLALAIKGNHLEIVKLLVDSGADIFIGHGYFFEELLFNLGREWKDIAQYLFHLPEARRYYEPDGSGDLVKEKIRQMAMETFCVEF
jgi:hypothetical protein